MESHKQFETYYLNLMKNNVVMDSAFDIYIFLKLQLMLFEKVVTEDITKIGNDLKTIVNEKTLNISNLNEFEYMEICKFAKKEYDFFQGIKPLIFLICQTSPNYEVQNCLNSSIDKYYSLDVSLTDDEKQEYRQFLIAEIKNDLDIDLEY